MQTEIGKYLRTLRAINDELLKDMADRLSISPALLSSIENGKRNVPKGFTQKITNIYRLNQYEQERLDLAIAKTKREVSMSLAGLAPSDQKLAFSFARRFSELNTGDKERIMRILERGINSDESL